MRFLRLFLLFSFASPLVTACGGVTAGSASDGGSPTGPETSTTLPPSCGAGQVVCRGGCTNLSSDPYNCGTCAYACPFSAPTCLSGQCTSGSSTPPSEPDAGSGLPTNPGGPAPSGGSAVTLAISKLYYGDTDRNGVSNPNAWQSYGLNIDGKLTTKTSTDVCTLAAGAAKVAQTDGNGGIDNSFGENILPILITVAGSNFSQTENNAIDQGSSTMMFAFGDLGSGADYAPLPAILEQAGPTATTAKWDGTDVRPTVAQQAAVQFTGGYMNSRVWVGSPPGAGTFDMHLWNVAGEPPVPMNHLQITMLVDPSNASATQGVVSAVLPTAQFVSYLQAMAGSISTSLCSGSAFNSIAQQIEQASDILDDGTNQAGVACNAISLGLGFDASAVQVGGTVTLPAPPNPCQ